MSERKSQIEDTYMYHCFFCSFVRHFTLLFVSPGTLLTVQLVIKELKTLDDWFMFGVTLGVIVSELRKIESAYKGSIERCKVETIQYWLDNNADASWKEVAQALEQIDQLALAAKVKKKYLWTTCEQEGVCVCVCVCLV